MKRSTQFWTVEDRKNILIQKAIFHIVPGSSQENISEHKKGKNHRGHEI